MKPPKLPQVALIEGYVRALSEVAERAAGILVAFEDGEPFSEELDGLGDGVVGEIELLQAVVHVAGAERARQFGQQRALLVRRRRVREDAEVGAEPEQAAQEADLARVGVELVDEGPVDLHDVELDRVQL